MRPYSNQNGGRSQGNGNGNRHSSGNRSGQDRGGHFNRDSREHRENRGRGDRENRGGYAGNSASGQRSHGFRPDRNRSHSFRDRDREQAGNRGHSHRPADREHSAPRGPRSSWVEVTGRGSEEAIQDAARRFNVNRHDLNIEVVDEGSKGFLGIGSKPARVKVALKSGAVMPFAEGVLTRLLRAMGLPDTVKSQKDSDGNSVLNIEGPSSGTLIGRHGHTLESLQYLVSKIVQRMTGDEHVMIVVDVENYLERQKEKLKELALGLAQKAQETGTEIPMRPMSSKDRRVVHMTLKENEHVTTESRGEGLRRRVVIVPKVKATAPVAAGVAEGVEPGNQAPPAETLPYSPEAMAEADSIGNVMPPEPSDEDDSLGNR
ncbi:MAG TPA: RNA-binding cell elongation regulator Jag/EloR [bacterium]|nr:RNA-binding cell elongation regulator Jag/EloR [bacterium]